MIKSFILLLAFMQSPQVTILSGHVVIPDDICTKADQKYWFIYQGSTGVAEESCDAAFLDWYDNAHRHRSIKFLKA